MISKYPLQATQTHQALPSIESTWIPFTVAITPNHNIKKTIMDIMQVSLPLHLKGSIRFMCGTNLKMIAFLRLNSLHQIWAGRKGKAWRIELASDPALDLLIRMEKKVQSKKMRITTWI
jgi:hypothetical protein